MRKYTLPIIGLSMYVIVTMIDVVLISLPMTFYVAVLICGALLVISFFLHKLPQRSKKTPEPKRMVFHFHRQQIMQTYAK